MPYPSEDIFTYDPAPVLTNPTKNSFGDWIAGIAATLRRNAHVSPTYGTYGTIGARLDDIDARTVRARNTGRVNLRVAPNAAAPLSRVTVTADLFEIEGHVAETVSFTINITVSGLDGLDTGVEASDTWYAIWAGHDPVNHVTHGTLSTSATRAGLTLSHASFAGYTAWRRVGWVRNDSAGNFIAFMQDGAQVLYDAEVDTTMLLSGANATTFTAIPTTTIQRYLPPGTRQALLDCQLQCTANTTVSAAGRATIRFRAGGSSLANGAVRAAAVWVTTGGTFQAVSASEQPSVQVSATRDLDYRLALPTGGAAGDYAAFVSVAGYLDGGV